MQNVFIFHGTEGYPEENWFPWLKSALEKKGCQVFVPQFPSPPIVPASMIEWFEVFAHYKKYINKDTVFIGHSLGGLFLLKILDQSEQVCKAAIFVGTPVGVHPLLNYERDNSFCSFNFDWTKIKSKAKHFAVFQSDNDPYVSLGNGEALSKHLGIDLSFIPNAGHFNTKAGYVNFPELLNIINSYL